MKDYKFYLILFLILVFKNLESSEINNNFTKFNDYTYKLNNNSFTSKNFEIYFKQKQDDGWKLIFIDNQNFNFSNFMLNFFDILKKKSSNCIFLKNIAISNCKKNTNSNFNYWSVNYDNKNNNKSFSIFIVFLPQYIFYIFLNFSYFIIFLIVLNLIRVSFYVKK